MPTQLQLRRGSNSEMSSFIGAVGELTVNTTNKSLHLHDGSTAGGIEFARVDLSNSTGSAATWTISDGTNTSTIVIGNDTLTVNGTTNQIDVVVGTDSVTLSTPDSGVTAASYGSSTAIPVVTVDAKGRVTAVTTASITAGAADTDELSEGSTNLYFTNARADARITNALKDEDNMASDSATHVPSQQSVKAYVDAQTTDETAEGSSNLYYTDARVSTRTDTILNHSNHTNVTVSKVGDELRLSAASSYGDSDVGSYLSSNDFATQTAIVAAITDSAPSTLDTLNELAAALGDDENFSATTATALGLRVSKTADTGAAIMPAGTTAQRPTPAAGHVRYNSDLEQIEAYTDAWVPLGGASTVNADTFTGNGSTTAYALSQTVSSEDNLLVFIEGVFQQQDAYSIATASGTTTLTFSAAPSNTNTILVYSFASNIQGSNLNIDTMTGDGSDVTLSLSIAPVNENNTQVFIDGVYQNKSGYSISGSTLTFSTAPPNGSAVEVMTMTQTEVNVPVDGTITSAKLSGDLTTPGALTVTGALTVDTDTLVVDATNNRVGIGTTPAYKLDIASPVIQFGDSTDAFAQYKSSAGNWHVGANSSNAFAFYSGTYGSGTELMRIDSSGNVQVGTGTPAYLVGTGDIAQLSVNRVGTSGAITNTARSAAFINVNGADGGSSIEFSTASANNTQPSERMRITGSGSVGIGKTPLGNNLSPALEMVSGGTMFGYGDAMYLTGNLYYNGGWKAIATGAGASMILDATGPKFYTNASASAGGTVTPTERMRVNSDGHVLVGVTNGSADVGGSTTGIRLGATGQLMASSSGTGTYNYPGYFDRRGTNNTGDSIALGLQGYLKSSIGVIGTSGGTDDGGITFNTWANNATRTTKMTIFNTVVASEVDVSIKNGKKIELQTTSGSPRGYISAQETNTGGTHSAGLIIATSGGESITFKDSGIAGTTNMVIDGSGDVSMPYKAYAYGTITGNPGSPTQNYGLPLTTASYQNCTPQTNSTHGPGVTITKAGFYTLYASVLYDPLSHDYVYLGWAVNGTQIHHWHSNHSVASNHDAVSSIGRYLNIGDHVTIEFSNTTISTIYGNAHSSWYVAKIG